jgi:8-oxo-dGTP pyrophosphatase MutT (NUDIX family)
MSNEERAFERIGSKTVYDGPFVSLRVDEFRFPDGEEVERVVVHHPGAVGIVACDEEHVVLTRQPREAVGDPDSLEIPAGKLDEGEEPEATARRELAEEVGLGAEHWEHLTSFYSTVGVSDEEVHVYLATGLHEEQADADENERIEIVRWPLEDLDGALAATRDAKTIIALQLLRERRRTGA